MRMTETQQQRSMPRRAITVAVVAVVVFGLIAAGAVFALMREPDGTDVAAASPTPGPSRLDAVATCALLVPTLDDAATEVLALADKIDGSTVNWDRVDTTIADLRTIKGVAPVDWGYDIELQMVPLRQMLQIKRGLGPATLELADFRASGLRLAGLCR